MPKDFDNCRRDCAYALFCIVDPSFRKKFDQCRRCGKVYFPEQLGEHEYRWLEVERHPRCRNSFHQVLCDECSWTG